MRVNGFVFLFVNVCIRICICVRLCFWLRDKEKMRYTVRPGLTGLAQVSGNIHIPWSERFQKDLEYIRNISFVNDCKIIIRTVRLIFVGEAYFVKKPLRFEKD